MVREKAVLNDFRLSSKFKYCICGGNVPWQNSGVGGDYGFV
jgi:hypothetical protein